MPWMIEHNQKHAPCTESSVRLRYMSTAARLDNDKTLFRQCLLESTFAPRQLSPLHDAAHTRCGPADRRLASVRPRIAAPHTRQSTANPENCQNTGHGARRRDASVCPPAPNPELSIWQFRGAIVGTYKAAGERDFSQRGVNMAQLVKLTVFIKRKADRSLEEFHK